MQYRNAFFGFALAAVSMMAALAAPQARASEIWHNDWIVQAPATPMLYPNPPSWDTGKPLSAIAFGPGGDVLFRAATNTYDNYQFVRISAAGALRSTTDVYAGFASTPGVHALRANADGGAFFAFGDPDSPGDRYDEVVRADANNVVVWARNVATGWLANAGSGRLASLGCSRLSMLVSASGNVIWQRVFNTDLDRNCDGGLLADEQGELFVAIGNYAPGSSSSFRTLKLAADGSTLWDVATTAASASLIGVSGATLYMHTATDVRALRATDGSLVWSAPISGTVLLSGDPAEPIVIGSDSVQRLASDTGQVRWNHPISGLTGVADIVDGAIIVASASGITKLDADNGSQAWTHPDATSVWRGFGGSDGSAFVGITGPWYSGSITFQRIDLADGGVAPIVTPSTAHGVNAVSVMDAAGDVVSAGMTGQTGENMLRVRRVDAATGVPMWETADAVESFGFLQWPLSPAQVAVGTDTVAVAVATSAYSCNLSGSSGAERIALYERASGQRRWSVLFIEAEGQQCGWVSDPAIDPNGNVVVAVGALVPCQNGLGFCELRSVYKLAAATGAVLWRVDNDGGYSFNDQAFPQAFSLLGSDVLLHGPFAFSQDTLRRISGTDGSVQWSSDVFQGNAIGDAVYAVDPSHLVVFSGSNTTIDWAELDINTGAAAWTSTTPRPACAAQSCTFNAADLVPFNGDLLAGGELNFAPSLKRYHNDGSGVVDSWVIGTGDATIGSGITNLWRDPGGAVRSYLYRGFKSSQGSLRFLSTFDFTSGALLGKQAIYAFNPDSLAWSFLEPMSAPAGHRLLVSTNGPPSSMPSTTGTALLETGETAHGNLAVTLSVDQASVYAGKMLGFHLTVTYAGDATLTGAHVFAVMPWQGGVTATCSGANCVLDTRTGDVNATFDIAPGGSIDITGQVRVLDQSVHPTMSARTWGPLGLSEQGILDNFAQATVTQSLFANGFDD